MQTFFKEIKTALWRGVVEGVRDAFSVIFLLVLGLTLAYFCLPRHAIAGVIANLYGWMMADHASGLWLLLCGVTLALKLLTDNALGNHNKKETP